MASTGQQYFNEHKGSLETRLGCLAPLLIELEHSGVISSLEREEVQSKSTSHEKNHTLIVMLERRGTKAQEKFYEALQTHDPHLVEDLQRSAKTSAVPGPQPGGAQTDRKSSLKRELQERLKNRFSVIHQECGVSTVQDIYTELCIVEGRTGGVNGEHEVVAIDMRQIGAKPSSNEKQFTVTDIFTVNSAKKVLTLGIAGVGKTVAVQKFVMDWAEKQKNQDIDFVFVLLFRELNLRKGESHSLFDLLSLFYPGLKELEKFTELYDSKILFIIDGLDESRLQMDFKKWITKPEEKSSVGTLISSIINSKLVPSALIWVTTRPAAANLIPQECFDLVTEVRGFNDDQKIEFFQKFFQKNIGGPEKAKIVIDHVLKNRSLHILCHIPVFCHIIGSVHDEMLRGGSKGEPVKTLTEMYVLYTVSQITRMKKYQDKEMTAEEKGHLLVQLGELAFKHLEEGTLIFYEKDFKKCDIDVKLGALEAGVCTQIFNVAHSTTGEKIFSFVHLSVQEFLAALYILHHNAVHWISPLAKTAYEKIWLFNCSRFDLYSFALKRSLQKENGELDLFVRFLLGLAPMLEPKICPPLDVILPRLHVRQESINKTIQYVKEKINENISPDRTINLFHCLNELGDNSLSDEINSYISSSSDEEKNLTPAQCSALAYLLLMSAENLDEFDLKKYLRSEEGLHRMLPVVKVSRRVWLNRCNLSKTSCRLLAHMLHSSPSHLRELDMSDNDLQDEGVELLCRGLRDPQCKLETLRVWHCKLSKTSCKMMTSLLQKTPSHLRELDMSDNDLQDEGVELLCVGLRYSQCKLEKLRLSGCLVTHKGCSLLASALKSNPSFLKELDLSYNHPGDSGVEELTDRLNDPNCKLETFRYDHGGECRIKPGLRKYACELTLDPNTAHRCLSLSEGNRKVTRMNKEQSYPDHPERFDLHRQVLCREGLSGRCYWEAEWSGDRGVTVAVAYKSIQRKAGGNDSEFGYNEKSWRLQCSGNSYSAKHYNKKITIPAPSSRSSRVGVYLDWPAGALSFYSVSSDTLTHLHTFHSTFTKPLYAGFTVRSGSSVSLSQIT